MKSLEIYLTVALIFLAVFVYYRFQRKPGDDMEGNPLNPEQIAKRRENLEKIIKLAMEHQKIGNDDVQKALGVSDATATRYLSYLVDLGKLVRIGERGHKVYYQLPPQ